MALRSPPVSAPARLTPRRYVKCELYERAAGFFGRAAELQPGDVKWRLMVASCQRRAGALGAALETYAGVHAEHPDNLECESCGA
jgi:intraflagellar transport protein 88